MKRKLWTLLLALGAALALCVGAGATHRNDFFDALITGSITLDSDVTDLGPLYVDSTLTIDLNGHVLEIPDGISVASGAQLTIMDSNPSAPHNFSAPNANGRWEWDKNGTETTNTRTVNGGVITGGTGQSNIPGGGVYVAPGGTLTMKGGSIVGCSAGYGGGVYVEGTFTMSGSAAIIGCAAGEGGGGVYVSGTFTMNGSAAITYCTTDTGGGVLVQDTGKFTMEDDSVIRGCTARTGGGVTVNGGESSGQFFMNGGQITGCTATSDASGGGGILNDGAVTMTGGEITNCTAKSPYPDVPESGGVRNDGPFTMSGGTIGTGCTILNIGSIRTVFTISGKAEIYADITNCSTLHADGGDVRGTVKNGHQSYNNPGTITGSGGTGSTTFHDKVENLNGTISGGTFEDDVTNGNGCTISGGKFNENVNNNGTIEGGDFHKYVTNNGTIKAAEDGSKPSFTSEVTNNGTISGGEFTGTGYVTNNGTISGGTFSETKRVSNNTGGTITGGTFKGPVINSGGKITGGDFAKLEGAYRVEFVSDGSAAAAPQYVSPGDKLTKPADPAKSGYTFGGWYKDSTLQTPWNFDTDTVAANTTLYAKWTAIPSPPSYDDSDPTYAVSAPTAENGKIAVSPRYAERGERVTVTVTPDEGYELDSLTVTDSRGDALELTDLGGGRYRFTMPARRVEVKASFVKMVEVSPFADVAADAYYYEAVKWAVRNGITDGVGNDLFAPGQPCTRAQIVTFLWRAAGSPEPKGTAAGMTDVVGGSYYEKAVAWAIENGVTTGTTATTFSPDATCTRAQAVTFLARALNAKASSAAEFSDVPTDSYFANAVAWAASNGVTEGVGNGLFAPDSNCTRGQIVTFLYRAYNK